MNDVSATPHPMETRNSRCSDVVTLCRNTRVSLADVELTVSESSGLYAAASAWKVQGLWGSLDYERYMSLEGYVPDKGGYTAIV